METEGGEKEILLQGEPINIHYGQVDDVLVNNESVVENHIADIHIKTLNNESIVGDGNIEIIVPTKTSDLQNDSNFVNSTEMENAIQVETTARENADINLQNQIDAITVSSDVIDVVGTYADLQNYDTQHVKANDIIKVLQDETHNNALSYYRWTIVGNVGSWVYVGSEGPFYTKSEADALLNGKVDNSELDNYYTKSEANTLLDGKVDNSDLNNYYNKTQVDTLIDNIPDNSILLHYGDTDNPHKKIEDALEEGKAVFLLKEDMKRVFSLSGTSGTTYYFYAWSTGSSNVKTAVSLTANNVWNSTSAYFLRITNTANTPYTISDAVDNSATKIPTSKAIKTYVDAQSGADVTALKEQVDELDLTVNGEQYDSTLCYFYVETTSANQALDLRTIYNDTNIKNETAGTCFVGYDDEEMTAIVSDASLRHTFAEIGIHKVRVSGITSLTSNLLFRNSTILKKAVIGNTLTTINYWLFNGVTMDNVLFLASSAPTFSGETGISSLSMNNVSHIRVYKEALASFQASALNDSNKAKLALIDTGLVGEVSYIETDITNISSSLADTQNDLEVLTDRFNDYTVVHDKDKTYITLNLTSDFYLDCRLLYHPTTDVYNDIQSLDWGDGNVIADVPTAYAQDDDNLRHNYTAGIYTIVLTGMTQFMGLWVRGNASRIEKVELSSQIGKIQYFAMDNLSNLVINNPVPFKIYNMSDVEITTPSSIGAVGSIEIPEGTYIDFYDNSRYDSTQRNAFVEPNDNILYKDITVTVGATGDYATINDAMRHLSVYYPTYKYGGIHAYIQIQSGTTISEQILVDGADWSWMEITYEDYDPSSLAYDNTAEDIADGTIVFDTTPGYNSVSVDATNFSGVTHDTRGDACLFRAENGGKLPIINCVFKLVTQPSDNKPVAGMVCNRGSEGVVKTLCGFIGFNDGVISNNESSITIREGITMDCARWGCHSRHNGEVSARSVIATGCATANTNESAALCSDRVADLDGREAYVSNSGVQIRCNNTSRMNCNGTHIIGSAGNTVEISNTYVSTSNCAGMFIDGTIKLTNTFGSTLLVNANYTFDTTYTFNTLSNHGVIYA